MFAAFLAALVVLTPSPAEIPPDVQNLPTRDFMAYEIEAEESTYVPLSGEDEVTRRVANAVKRGDLLLWRAEQAEIEKQERIAAEAAAAEAAAEAERQAQAEREAAAAAEQAAAEAAVVAEAEAIAQEAAVEQAPEPSSSGGCWEPWCSLAQCESGGTWDYDSTRYSWGNGLFDGGLQFQPSTWTSFKDPGDPQYAWQASVARQIAVAEKVLASQGWGAWPTCSLKLGLR